MSFWQAEDPKRFCQQHRLNHRSLSKAVDIHKQLKGYLERIGVPVPAGGGDACTEDSSGESLRRALTAGLFMNAATLQFDSEILGELQSVFRDSRILWRLVERGWRGKC